MCEFIFDSDIPEEVEKQKEQHDLLTGHRLIWFTIDETKISIGKVEILEDPEDEMVITVKCIFCSEPQAIYLDTYEDPLSQIISWLKKHICM